MEMARKSCLYFSIAVVLACVLPSSAQSAPHPLFDTNPRHLDAQRLGHRVVLGPEWLFSPDDNPANASIGCDDSTWKTESSDQPLPSGDLHNSRYAWYRMHVKTRPNSRYLAVETQYINGSYELYANGVRIGANGRMNNLIQSAQNYLSFYPVPMDMVGPSGDLVIAIRVALNRVAVDGRFTATPFNGGAIMLASRDAAPRDASYEAVHGAAIPFVLSGLSFIVGLVALALYLAMRSRMEYLAIAVSLIAEGLQSTAIGWSHLHTFTANNNLVETLWLGISNVALIEFVRLILDLRLSRWLIALEIANSLGYFAANLNEVGYLSGLPTLVGYFLPALTVKAVLVILLVRGLNAGNRDARVVLPAVAIISVANYWYFLITVNNIWQWHLPVPALPVVQFATYSMDFWSVWNVIYCVTMLLFLVLRTIGIARERAQVAAELEAARVVQHVLIPEDIPDVPGFTLQSVYRPAGQVGGDFFQIIPVAKGGVLVAIGDVSGKGMPAAMTVSLLVGTFRTLAHYTQNPSDILSAMNTRMMARSHGGFTTCLVLRADADGTVAVANAGHIAPYLAGKELPLENGLPLGLSATAHYIESTFRISPGQQVTLITDGVVEARDKTGALFGFDRTASLSIQPAEAIARAAQTFGQEDDITALTLIATVAPHPALA
jgi:hypothetical protein